MADLSPEETAAWYGGNTPSNQQIINEANRGSKDPFGYWWDTFVNGNTAATTAAGAGGVGPKPIRSGNDAYALAGAAQLAGDVRNAADMDAIARAGAMQGSRASPFSAGIANQSRPAQLALLQQMQALQNGPSLASMQGQRAQGQNLQAALAAGGGRPAMMQAGAVGAGLAGDTGTARLAEMLRGSAQMGGLAGNLRGMDLQTAGRQAQFGIDQMRQDDSLRQMYAQLGMSLQNARDQAAANRDVTRYQLLNKRTKQDVDAVNNTAQGAGTIFSMGAGGAK